MEQPKANDSSSMRKHAFGVTSSRAGPGFDRKPYAPFQAIIEKGKQAKAQDESDQYEARKAKRETDVKNAARIRHAEAEANRRRIEESRLSVGDHKGKLLDEMTKNIKAILENQYREEIREKVYEDKDKIVSAYEHDIKDQTKIRLVRELEPVVKTKLGAEFESDVKQQLAVELVPVVKAELRAKYETEVKQQLVKDFGPEVVTELRAKYETEVKQQLAEELQLGVKAELHAKYEGEVKNQLLNDLKPTIVNKLRDTQTSDVQNEPQAQRDTSYTLDGESSRFTPNDIDNNGGEYPDLSQNQQLINQNGVRNDQQEAGSVRNSENSETGGDALEMPHGTKRSLSGEDDEEEDPYAHHSKRSRSASFKGEEQHLPSGYEEGVSNIHSSYSHIQQLYQGVPYNSADDRGFPQHNGDAGHEDAQGNNGYKMDGEASGYVSSDEVQGSNGNILDGGGADYNSAEDIQETNGNLLHGEEVGYTSDEGVQGINGNFLDGEEADYYSEEDSHGSNGYKMDGEPTEPYSSEEEDEGEDEEEDEEQYESEEEEQYSTAPQAAAHSTASNGVIKISNTQDTAFVLSDSEDDEAKTDDKDETLIGYEGPTVVEDAKHYAVSVEESLFVDAGGA